MAYTVKKLSELSGVTIRTLHYYEEEGLLTPLFMGPMDIDTMKKKSCSSCSRSFFSKELGFTIKQNKEGCRKR